jgi:hypothetical protein
MTGPPAVADPGELSVWCMDYHHNATMPVARPYCPALRLKRRFPRCGAGSVVQPVGSRHVDVRPHWAACQAAGQITPP